MFGDAQSDTVASTSGIDSRSLEKELADKEAALRAVQTVDGAWNFCLVRTRPGAGGAVFQRSLAAELDNAGLGVQLRDWRQTAGGNASIIFFLSLFFNTGMVFITGIAIFIVTNSLALSIHERTREIGTMRALGAQKSFVVKLLAAETLALVGGAGLVGVGLGMAGLRAVALMGIPLANPLLVSLFGTTVLRPELSLQQVVFHLGFSVAVGCAALVWPVWIAIRIQPIRALSKD